MGLREAVADRIFGRELRELRTSSHDFRRFASAVESYGLSLADLELALEDIGWMRIGSAGREQTDLLPWERQRLVQRSRVYYQRDPLVTRAVSMFTDYCFARPWTLKANDERVQEIIDATLTAPVNKRVIGTLAAQRRQSDRLLVDGERFFAIFVGQSTEPVKVRTIDCLQVEDAVTNPDDAEDVWGYRRVWTPPDGQLKRAVYADWEASEEALDGLETIAGRDGLEFQPPDEVRVSHLAINSIGLRGLPMATAGLDWSQAHRKFMEDRATITRARAAFAFRKKVKGGPQAVAQAATRLSTDAGGMSNPPPIAGSTLVENEGSTLEPIQMPQDARNAEADGRLLKLLFSSATGIAEPFFGNADNSNLATAKSLLRPMELMFAAYQLVWLDWYEDLFQHAIEWGGLSVEDNFIDIDAPPIVEQDIAVTGKTLVDFLAALPPLAGIPEVIQYALTILGINNVDEIMERLEKERQAGPEPTEGGEALRHAMESVLYEMRVRVGANGR